MQDVKTQRHRVAKTKKMLVTELRHRRLIADVLSRVTTTVEKLGHTAGEAVVENKVAPTCTADGSYDTVVYESELDRCLP